MRSRLAIAGLLALFQAALPAAAAPAASSPWDACTECHGEDGMGRADPGVPVIAGMPAAHIEEAIYAYVDGARQCTEEPRMCATVAALSDSEVSAVARHFAALERGPSNEPFDAALAQRGAALYERHCAACHRPPDDPDVADAIGIPLHGQRASYIRYAIRAYFAGTREPLLETMAHELRQLDDDDIEALVNYFASYRATD